MQIHELNNFTGTLGSGAYLAIDDGTDTGKISSQELLAATEARIDNIIAGPAPSAEEIVDARLGADGVTYPSLGDAIRDQFTDVKADSNHIADIVGGLPSFDFVRGIVYQGRAVTTDSLHCIVMPQYVTLEYDVTVTISDGYRYGFQRVVPTGTVEDEYGNMTAVSSGTTTGSNTFVAGVPFRLFVTKNGATYNVPADIAELQYALNVDNNEVKFIKDSNRIVFITEKFDPSTYSKSITEYTGKKITIERSSYNANSIMPTQAGFLLTYRLGDVANESYQEWHDAMYSKDIYVRGFNSDNSPQVWIKQTNAVDLDRAFIGKSDRRYERAPIISILDDDGSVEMYNKMFPLAQQYNIPMCQALCTYYVDGNDDREVGEYVKWKQIQEMHNYGFEFITHSYRHKNYTTLSIPEMIYEMTKPIDDFKNHGIAVRGLSYPNGASNPTVRTYVSQYYDFAVMGETPHQEFRVNSGFIPSYFINRSIIGSYFDKTGVVNGVNVVNPSDTPTTEEYIYTNSLEYYKMVVDECIAKRGWLCIETHCWHPDMDSTQWEYFEEVIQYALQRGAIFKTCSEAYDIFKNAYESGDFLGYWNDTYDPYTGTGGHGIAVNQYGEIDVPANKYDSTVTSWNWSAFPNNRVSIYRMYDNTLTKIPEISGIIEVHKTTDPQYSFEMFYSAASNNAYQRKFNASGEPQTWVKVMGAQ